jgi:RimJ/RimL family protein N-acetyltransferase
VSVSLRRATTADVDFIAEVYADEDVRPFLAASGRYDNESVREEIERWSAEPDAGGVMLIESDGSPAGVSMWRRVNERSRIAHLGGLAVHPAFRGDRISDEAARQLQRWLVFELGFHRLELEVYGFNDRAQRHAERAGFVREGVKRKAYRRGDGWVDSVCYALVEEDLSASEATPRPDPGGGSGR